MKKNTIKTPARGQQKKSTTINQAQRICRELRAKNSGKVYNRYDNTSLEMITNTQAQCNRVIRGAVVYNEANSNVLFVQNPPRPPRSKRLLRTTHFSLVLRRDGSFHAEMDVREIDIRVKRSLKNELQQLIDEMEETTASMSVI